MITFTGIDEQTDLIDARNLADELVEFGILVTAAPDGRKRYPSMAFIDKAVRELRRQSSLHVCGQRAKNMLYSGELDHLLQHVGRLQVNGDISPDAVTELCEKYALDVITQHAPRNELLAFTPTHARHSVLIDGSGGRGILPAEWPALNTRKPVGFAGGLGPHNLAVELPRIMAKAAHGWWIDMEASLRDEQDQFDMGRAWSAYHIYDTIITNVPDDY